MKENKWVYLVVLSLTWGSSFILMKKALLGMSPIQIGAFRILIAGFVLVLIGYKRIKEIKIKHWKPIFIVAYTATFFPAFFFAFAISEIDSSVSAVLSSLTPLITMIIGMLFFGFIFTKKQMVGILVGLLGTLLLIVKGAEMNPSQNYYYAILILLASVGYALSMNVVKKDLNDLNALGITVGCFLVMIPPTIIVLFFSGFFQEVVWNAATIESLSYVGLLAVFGTAIAKVLFNRLVQISTPVFSSSVTYLITVVAVGWGFLDGERLSLSQVLSIVVIFTGVYLVNKKKRKQV